MYTEGFSIYLTYTLVYNQPRMFVYLKVILHISLLLFFCFVQLGVRACYLFHAEQQELVTEYFKATASFSSVESL